MSISRGALAAIGVLTACSDPRGTAIKAGVMTYADSADQVFFGVQAPMEAGGVKRGTLYADTMYVLNESSRFDFTVGHADFNTETGKPNGSMKADRGRYDQRTQILEGWGHVVVKTVDGKSLKSPHIVYNQLHDEITSDTTFEATEPTRVTTGIGFRTDHNLNKKICDRSCNVKAQGNPEMTASRRVLVGVLIAASLPDYLVAQGLTNCDFQSGGRTSNEMVGGVEVSTGSGGIKVTCKSRNLTLVADSGRKTGEIRTDLYGHVHYIEPAKIDLRSDFLTYFQADERVIVTGHVIATTPTGSTLIGPEATYLRNVPNRRQFEELTAPHNPTVTIISKGDSAKPVTMNAATIYMRGDSLVYGSRNVVVTRVDMISHSDSAFLDGRTGHETTRLMFNPSVEGLQGRKFKLIGEIIDAYTKERKLDRVIARGKGHAISQDLDILADTIDLRITGDALERAIAWSKPGQSTATSPNQSIVADSIDIDMPKQKVRVIYAVRRAFAQADADTVRFRTTEKDWLRGDLVTAWFDTTVTKDTSSTPPIKRIVATHRADSARAYYHMAANDTSFHTPTITYVRGRQIQLDFDNRKIALVTVKDSVSGIVLEPSHDSTKVAGTKTKTKANTRAASKGPTKTVPPPATTTPIKKPPATMQGPGH